MLLAHPRKVRQLQLQELPLPALLQLPAPTHTVALDPALISRLTVGPFASSLTMIAPILGVLETT